jgi:hypothetical protein
MLYPNVHRYTGLLRFRKVTTSSVWAYQLDSRWTDFCEIL